MKKLLFILFIVAIPMLGKAQAWRVFTMSDNNPELGFQGTKECCAYAFQKETGIKAFGTSSMRVELNKTDPVPTDGSGSRRAEKYYNYGSSKTAQNGNIRWYAFSMFSPAATNASDPAEEIRFQLHSNIGSPVCALELKSGTWRIARRNSSGTTYTNIAAINYDAWEHWIFYFVESQAGAGEIRIWRNDVELYRFTGTTNYNNTATTNAIYPYPNIGIYKWPWATTWNPASTSTKRVFYIDSVFYGTSAATYDNMDVTPNVANVAPVVTVGANQTIAAAATTASVTASATDSDGSITSESLTQVSGPVTAVIGAKSGGAYPISGLTAAGTYVLQYSATDNGGATSSATTQITKPVVTNQPPTIDLSGNTTSVSIRPSFTVVSSASDPDGTISSRLWQLISGPDGAVLSGTTTSTLTVTGVTGGEYDFQLTVTDNNGATTTATITIMVYGSFFTVPKVSKKDVAN